MAFKKTISVLLVALLAGSLAITCFSGVQAQSIPKPSVPEFSLNYAVHSIDVPGSTPTYTIDPYNGQQKIQDPGSSGYHIDRRVVEIKVKNQPFTQYYNANNYQITLYYNVSYKGAYETEWKYYYYDQQSGGRFWQSNTDYTIINFTEVPNDGGTIQFRVQAQIGYYEEYYMPFVDYAFHGEVSGWSSTQSVEVPAVSQSSPSPTSQFTTPTSTTTASPTATPASFDSAPESQENRVLYGAIAGLGSAVIILAVAVALLYKRIKGMELKHNVA